MASANVNIITMLAQCFLFLLIVTPLIKAKKESFEDNALDQDELFGKLMKRLGIDPEKIDGLEQLMNSKIAEHEIVNQHPLQTLPATETPHTSINNENEQCSKSIKELGKIIKASESIKAGAIFIISHEDVESNTICNKKCCDNSTCDVSVYQDKGDRTCYLFNCSGRCVFKSHSGYSVNTIPRPNSNRPASHSEDDLKGLAGSEDNSNQSGDNEDSDLAKGKKSNAGQSRASYITPHTAQLSGQCQADVSCEDPNAACVGRVCVCGRGYYRKEGLCRKECNPKTHYECFELGTLTRGAECVPLTQVCDNYMQCADGSDEYNCEAKQDAKEGSSSEEKSSKVNKSHEDNSESEENSNSSESEDVVKTNKGNSKAPAPKSPPSAPSKGHNSSTAHSEGEKDKPGKSPPTAVANKEFSKESPKSHVFMEKVIIASHTDSAQGPIIALSLGLAFTLILLVMVGCRLKSVKTRLRKGRPLSQNEADYLINGMYL